MRDKSLVKRDVAGLDIAREKNNDVFSRLKDLNEKLAEKFGGNTVEVQDDIQDITFESGPKGDGKGAKKKTAPTDLVLTNSLIMEDAKAGTEVGKLLVTDKDARDNHTFTLLNDAGGRFAISGSSIVLAQGHELDFETTSSFEIKVLVTDKFGLTYTETMTINIGDVENEAPVVEEPPAEEPPAEEPPAEEPPAEEPPAEEPPAEEPPAEEPPAEEPPAEEPPTEPSDTLDFDVPDYVLEALIPGDINAPNSRWNADQAVGSAVTVTYAFASVLPDAYSTFSLPKAADGAEFTAFNSTQMTAVREIFEAVESYTNITFVETNDANSSDISFGSYLMTSDIGGYAYYPSNSQLAGDVWITTRWDTLPNLNAETAGDWARFILSHEIGHALGLEHSHTGGLPEDEDGTAHSVMSYHYDHGAHYSMDFQMFDIAALQHLYGVNDEHNTGDDLYHYDAGLRPIDTIWDAGGHDTLSAEGSQSAVVIDLRESAFSAIGRTDNVAIAFGTKIEDAIGGNANDRLTGNDGDNRLDGSLGNDILTGLAGNDTFVINGSDKILDFEDGSDLIEWQFDSFDDLIFSQSGDNAIVNDGEDQAILVNVNTAQLDESDFVNFLA